METLGLHIFVFELVIRSIKLSCVIYSQALRQVAVTLVDSRPCIYYCSVFLTYELLLSKAVSKRSEFPSFGKSLFFAIFAACSTKKSASTIGF